jgi:hypothetical protein
LAILGQKLPEIQEVIAKSKLAMMEIVMGVEDELGDIVARLVFGNEMPRGPCVNLCSSIGVALETIQSVAKLIGKIAQQVKITAGSINQASQTVNQASAEVTGIRAQVVVVSKKQRDDEVKVGQIGRQLMQLTQLMTYVKQESQQHKAIIPPTVPLEVNGIPRKQSESASSGGKDILKWVVKQLQPRGQVVNTCSPEDWQYVMDMSTLYMMIFIERDLIPKEDKGAYNHV